MKDRIKDYFAFNNKEQRGLIILLVLLLLSLLINLFLPRLVPEKEFDISSFQQEVEKFMASVNKQDSVAVLNPKRYSYDGWEEEGPVLSAFLASPFVFDPNDLSEEQWVNMGMNSKIIRNIMRYRNKGGTFRDKEGFRKIYGMEDSVYAILSPYIRITEKEKATSSFSNHNYKNDSIKPGRIYTKYKADTIIIELNMADSASLLALNGIGPSYAGRIIKYRELLGGFYQAEQLLEIRGMDSIRFNGIREQITTDPGQIRKIDLNLVTFKDLLRHPYFEYYLVKAIFNYKNEIKSYDSVGQLKKIPVMFDELYEKIAPYLEVKM